MRIEAGPGDLVDNPFHLGPPPRVKFDRDEGAWGGAVRPALEARQVLEKACAFDDEERPSARSRAAPDVLNPLGVKSDPVARHLDAAVIVGIGLPPRHQKADAPGSENAATRNRRSGFAMDDLAGGQR